MQNTFYLAENVNTHKQTAKGTCKGARRKKPKPDTQQAEGL